MIAHVVLGLHIGGLERVVVNLVRKLDCLGHKVIVICLEDGGEFADELREEGIPIHILHKARGFDWRTAWKLKQLLQEQHVVLIHTHNPGPHFYGTLASLGAGISTRVHTKHGRNYPHLRKQVLINRILSWLSSVIVPVSDNAAGVALRVEKVNPKKIHRIWNGVDSELYRPAVRSQVNQGADGTGDDQIKSRHPVIGTVARLSPEKDQMTMLTAFRLVLDRLPDARLILVGDGPCHQELQHEAKRLAISQQVAFLGARSDVAAILPSFSLFTLSSLTEGISMTILEAMACGLPIVATDVGGNREIVNPPECGLVVPEQDPHALSEAYLKILLDPMRHTQMGIAARQRVVDHFSINTMVCAYTTLYEKLLTKGHLHPLNSKHFDNPKGVFNR